MRPGLFRDPAAAFFVRGVAVFRRRSRFGDPGKEENFRSGPAPRALPCAASCAYANGMARAPWGGAYAGGVVRAASRASAGTCSPRTACAVGACRIGRR